MCVLLTTYILHSFDCHYGLLLGCLKLEIIRFTSKTKQSCTSKSIYEITDMFCGYRHYELIGMLGIHTLLDQARNQPVTPGVAKGLLRGDKFLNLCPIVLEYIQNIFPLGAKIYQGEAPPTPAPLWLRACVRLLPTDSSKWRQKLNLDCEIASTFTEAPKYFMKCSRKTNNETSQVLSDETNRLERGEHFANAPESGGWIVSVATYCTGFL